MQKICIKKIDEWKDQEEFDKTFHEMDSIRKAKIAKCKNQMDKLRSTAAGVALREVLLDADIPVEQQIFSMNSQGKMYLINYPSYHISVSHSGEYAIAIVCDQAVGVDLEQLRKRKNIDSIAKRCFSENEMIEFYDNKSEEAFFHIWTRKEALVKAMGTGLGIDLRQADTCRIGKYKTEKLNEDYIFTICILE